MLSRIFWFFIALVCLFCSLFAFVPILGKCVDATVTENSSHIVYVKRAGRLVYVNKNGYEQPKTRTEYNYTYEFFLNGEKITGTGTELELIHKKGNTVKVYYLPFYPKIHTSTKPINIYLLSGISFLCGIVLMRSVFTGRRPEINLGPKYSAYNQAQFVSQNQNPQPVQQYIPPQQQTFPQVQQIQQVPQIQNTGNSNGYAFCPKCGSPLGSGFSFCPKCGCKC